MHVVLCDFTEFQDEIPFKEGRMLDPEKILIFRKRVKW